MATAKAGDSGTEQLPIHLLPYPTERRSGGQSVRQSVSPQFVSHSVRQLVVGASRRSIIQPSLLASRSFDSARELARHVYMRFRVRDIDTLAKEKQREKEG